MEKLEGLVEIPADFMPTAAELPGELKYIAEVIGVENTLKIAQVYQGCKIYICGTDSLSRKSDMEATGSRKHQGEFKAEFAKMIGTENTKKMAQAYSGVSVYINSIGHLLRKIRNMEIRNYSDQGATALQVAKKFKLSTRRIEQIINNPDIE